MPNKALSMQITDKYMGGAKKIPGAAIAKWLEQLFSKFCNMLYLRLGEMYLPQKLFGCS